MLSHWVFVIMFGIERQDTGDVVVAWGSDATHSLLVEVPEITPGTRLYVPPAVEE